MITNHSFRLAENIPIGTLIGTIAPSNNMDIAYYSIIDGNTGSAFSINTNGELMTVANLDHDTISVYNMLLLVSDHFGNNAITKITVNISDVDAPSVVATLRADEIQNNNAILNANLTGLGTNSNGDREVNEYGFLYSANLSQSTSLRLGRVGVKDVAGATLTNTGSYSFAIVGLSPGTTYYFRAFAVNDGGTSYGEVSNFSTTYHQNFALNSASDGVISNILHAISTHTYNVLLSHQTAYSLNLEATSGISNNAAIYEGTNTSPLYIKAGPFSESTEGMNVTFFGISNGTRYMVLPLASNTHRIVISNNSSQNENYSLNLEEYMGTNPATGRMLTTPGTMGYYDSTNDTRFFWSHIPPNKNLQVALDAIRTRSDGSTAALLINDNIIAFSSFLTDTRSLSVSNSEPQYRLLTMRNTSGVLPSSAQQTIARFIFSFVDP